jgi:replicative DNA helicase
VARILERDDSDVFDPHASAKGYIESLVQRQAGTDPGLVYGIPGMDQMLLPARRGRLILLAARPSVGKTAMAESIADSWATQGRGPVLFVSLEMDREELLDRAMARDTGVSAEKIARGRLDPKTLETVLEAASARSNGTIHYMDEGSITTARIRAAGARLKMMTEGELAGVIVDYTQLLEDRVDGNDNTRVAYISRALKQTAKALRCPVLAMSQLNRNIESERRRPRLSDLRDSGALEQDADVVMIMTGVPGEAERTVHILKQRQGRPGELHIAFDGRTMTWREMGMRSSLADDDDVWSRLGQPETAEPSRW